MYEFDQEDRVTEIATSIASDMDADVLFYNGGISRMHDHKFIQLCASRSRKRRNVLLVLVTSGGDAHAAYRIARCLQEYDKFFVFVPGWCKSAGTLVVIGANELFIGPLGELGPLDVQRSKQDELWETSSGLTEDAALETLEKTAFKMFRNYLFGIKGLSRGQVTFGTAADVAAKFVIGQLQPVYSQINPAKIGENARAMNIAIDYGMRLNLHSGNLRSRRSLSKLASTYSSHGFVIDRKEAEELFSSVSAPTTLMRELCATIGDGVHFPLDDDDDEPPVIRFLSEELKDEVREQHHETRSGFASDASPNTGRAVGAAPDIAGGVVSIRTPRTESEGKG